MIELSENISDYIFSVFGKEFLERYKEYVESDYVSYIRIPGADDEQKKIVSRLSDYNIKLEKVENVPNAYRLLDGYSIIGKTLEFALGKYYIQSLSSMIPPLLLNPTEVDTTLDLCAAPGSKSTQIAELMNKRGTFYANEISIGRIKSLAHNLDKFNIINVGVMNFKGELISKYIDNYFDKILVDVPCSGLGIVQKKQEVSNWWNKNQAVKLSATQLKLLISAIKIAKVGAEIVYSTCTLTIEENELVIEKVLEKYPVELVDIDLPVKSHPGFTNYGSEKLNSELAKTKRIIPWDINSEGFFIAKLRKTGETEPAKKVELKKSNLNFVIWNNKYIKKYLEELSEWFGIPIEVFHNYKYLIKKTDIHFIDAGWNTENLNLFNRAGIKLGRIDKNNRIILHTLAAQIFQNHITQNIVELTDTVQLNTYMKGGTIKLDVEPKGRKVVKYKNEIIGSAIATKDGLKSQFPRALRTGEIII